MIVESIKEGFAHTNKNLQIVLIRIAMTVVNLFSLFIFLGVPLIAAVVYLGLDIAGARDLLPFLLENPFEFVSRYLGILVLTGASFICYLLFSSLLKLYVLSGCLGVLRNTAVNLQYTFSLSSFLNEANQNFFRLLRVLSLVVIVLGGMLFVFLIIAGAVTAAVQSLSGGGTTIDMFFRSFVVVSTVIFGMIIFLAAIVVSVYSLVASVVERGGAADSMKRTAGLLKDKPAAFLFCIAVLAAALVCNIAFFALKIPFSVLPLLGAAMSMVIVPLSVAVQSYIAIAVWASLTAYYIKATNYPVYAASYEI